MCGIAAVLDLSADPEPGRRELGSRIGTEMLTRLRHRGPDGESARRVGPHWLGHTRLSIVDLPGGRQPMAAHDHRTWVAVNGEIYNHAQLRAELSPACRRGSDSEVVLHLLADRGPDALHDLRGMWAFCAAAEDGEVTLARDPLGVKPLYWARGDARVLVASELAAFPVDARPHVDEFPPGHYWTPSRGLVRYVDRHALERTNGFSPTALYRDREAARSAVREALVAAVQERMMADVPIGVFLSGGLDSSLVAAIMARVAAPGVVVRSFAAGTDGSSDLAAARVVAQHLGLEHHERVYSDDEAVAVLPQVVRATESFEPSLIRSAVPNFLLAQLAARHVKVVLTGEGADELFAGYHHLRELSEDALAVALVEGVAALHNLNLQRCDRVTMAHGLEARVPFLSRDVLAVAERVPTAWKLLGVEGQEKALLREAFEGWLPDEILWRRKEQFGEGSGTVGVMERRVEELVPEPDWASIRLDGLPAPRTREELAYQRIFHDHLHGVPVERVLGRFATP